MPGYRPVRSRFWQKVHKTETCWLWTGAKSNCGYGRFNLGADGAKRAVFSHRYAWELLRGPIGDGLVLDHLCGVRYCVNPDHLELVTMNENARRGNRHRRHVNLLGLPLQESAQLVLFTEFP